MTINGLGFTDVGDPSPIGGLAREFYHRIWQYYRERRVWRWQERAEFADKAQGIQAINDKDRTMWVFEPHVAEKVFDDPTQYELLVRLFASGWRNIFHLFEPLPNRKVDANNYGPFSTDNVGMNYEYPEGLYDRRREIIVDHDTYQKGLMYFLAHDPPVPGRRAKRSLRGYLSEGIIISLQ